MGALLVGLLVTACVFAGGVLGLNLHRLLPRHHLTKETQDVIRLGSSTISVLASLVFGLLIATAKTTYDTADRELRAYAADLSLLDRALRHGGPDAAAPRELLRQSTARTIQDLWPASDASSAGLDDASASVMLEQTAEAIRGLTATTTEQRWAQEEAMQIATSLLRQRWLLIEQAGPSVRPFILAVLVSWTVAIFISLGLNAPRNGTVVASLLICAFIIGGAVFLILEMDNPFDGVMSISERSMLNALGQMER
ncbi:DUF4239 domain-containing protein [Roseomonas aerophila]|uniref:DUF4239 domain-containing protein n=1 Tax=Teichococcus aerophilus TaxID=1224513 RepID=A0ABR7RHS3_9PROT|nr:DUF4239 domain-containing protein [Pseudoroseomonas aerophila]MBC9206100.1 DUF4239 domain-containing protein [Pseudoroseomonas aerophila]